VVDRLLGRVRESPTPVAEPDQPAVDPEAAVWARVQLARNLRRPRTLELVAAMADPGQWVELHGDRLFGDDEAIVSGLARIDGRRVVVIGHQKGAETEENIRRNFGMPHPEGYRKAMRAMELAERFRLPVVTFVDTPGAFPGPAAEERGVAEAIARSVGLMSRLRTPIVTVITGEGGSGGALAIAVGDVVIGLENAVYSVISPEGCASILWRTSDKAAAAALAMRMSAQDQLALGVMDLVVDEPGEGAHTDHAETARRLRAVISEALAELTALPIEALLERRYARYRAIGPFQEIQGVAALQPERLTLAGRLQGLFEAGRRTIGDNLPTLPALPGGRRGEDPRRGDDPRGGEEPRDEQPRDEQPEIAEAPEPPGAEPASSEERP
jgi:acetyl-CoA carboxylase carboxyl transferase alpha subunit